MKCGSWEGDIDLHRCNPVPGPQPLPTNRRGRWHQCRAEPEPGRLSILSAAMDDGSALTVPVTALAYDTRLPPALVRRSPHVLVLVAAVVGPAQCTRLHLYSRLRPPSADRMSVDDADLGPGGSEAWRMSVGKDKGVGVEFRSARRGKSGLPGREPLH